jgi:hypothetical protein
MIDQKVLETGETPAALGPGGFASRLSEPLSGSFPGAIAPTIAI